MALFATIERDSPDSIKLITLAHLASDFRDKVTDDPQKPVNIMLYGYLTTVAETDSVKEDIERNLMGRSLASISNTLIQMAVPVDKLYVGDMVFSADKGRKIDLFLEQQGEARHSVPSNPPRDGRPLPTVNPPKPVKDAELTINSNKELVLEVTAKTIKSGTRTVVPELSLKSSTGISPVDISNGFSAQLVLWKPKLEGLLRKLGQEGLADKVEFSLNIVAGGALTKEFAKQISAEVVAQLQAALTFDITIPGTSYELPIELSYSWGPAYKADNFEDPTNGNYRSEGQAMIKVTIFRFKSW